MPNYSYEKFTECADYVCRYCTESNEDLCSYCPVSITDRKLNPNNKDDSLAKSNIKNATFVSVWDGGVHVTSPCKVNIETREIIEISPSEDEEMTACVEHLDYECVIVDGHDYKAVEIGASEGEQEAECGPNDFWYMY